VSLNNQRSFRSPYLFYLLTVGVEVVNFHLITLRHTPQSVSLLWTRDRPVAETSTRPHKHLQETNIHARGGIRTDDPSKRSAADLRLRPRGHWERLNNQKCGSIIIIAMSVQPVSIMSASTTATRQMSVPPSDNRTRQSHKIDTSPSFFCPSVADITDTETVQ
jgi:hypothetical protein